MRQRGGAEKEAVKEAKSKGKRSLKCKSAASDKAITDASESKAKVATSNAPELARDSVARMW